MDIVHYSVLNKEVLEYLTPKKPDGLVIDCTLGEGGHSELFLKENPDINVIGLDADPEIQKVAMERLSIYSSRMRFYNEWFNCFFDNYPPGDERPDSILFDLGISVYHYKKGERGFSFKKDEVLDMRLGGELEISAADIINNYPEKELADLFYNYGEERYSRRIARAIVLARKNVSVNTTGQLEEIIWKAVPAGYRHGRIHPGTKSFQALRIAVNGELARLESALQNALRVLKPGGRIGVISFHSLEDRIVKRFFSLKNKTCTCPPEQPICKCGGEKVVKILTRKPIRPSDDEIRENEPSRSSKLRVAEKLRDEEY